MTKILVTGGAGFIGSHIADALVGRGHEVLIIDDLSSGQEENIPAEAQLEKMDIADFSAVNALLAKEKPEIVYHLAAQIDVRRSVEDPVSDARTNILSSVNLADSARKNGAKKIFFSSSGGAIYGDTADRPTSEKHAEWPLSPYGIAKLAVDKYLNYLFRVHNFPFVSLRYSNVYGPRQNPHGEAGVVAIFINRMLQGIQPVINGDGRQTRDYVFVEDVVRANLAALDKIDAIGIFNIGTGKETSVNDIFRHINFRFENKFQEEHAPAKAGEQAASSLDFSRAAKELGWSAETGLEEGLEKTVEYFRTKN